MIFFNKLLTKLIILKNLVTLKAVRLFTLFLKVDIYLIHFFSSNIIAYTFYILCILYSHFLSNQVITLLHVVSYLFVYSLIGSSLQFYILCNISRTRSMLQNAFSEQFLIEKLGNKLCAKPLVIFSIGLISLLGIEFLSLYIDIWNHEIELDTFRNGYKDLFGETQSEWSAEQKNEYFKAFSQVFLEKKTKV